MTTEVAILNQSAVALAADSAVTVSTPDGLKVYDGVNKLFELVRGRPVGVMIYNSADLSHRPWETVIKTYRQERRAAAFDTLDEYVEDFVEFIASHRGLFSTRQQSEAVSASLMRQAEAVRERMLSFVRREIDAKGDEFTNDDAQRVGSAVIEDYSEWVTTTFDPNAWARPIPAQDDLLSAVGNDVDGVIDHVFQQLPISGTARDQLRHALIGAVFGYANDSDYSGLVFAGFGENEYYPRLREVRFKGMYADTPLVLEPDDTRTEITISEPAAFKSFAQGDMVRSFTAGIQDQVRNEMNTYWSDWVKTDTGATQQLVDERLSHLAADDQTTVLEIVQSVGRDAVDQFFAHMNAYEVQAVRAPLLQSVAVLPKDEMGAMAESLVNLTTLKRRVSINEAQTVGGAVDVGVISRGDGFVWLKRKHYFDQALNPSWASSHAPTEPNGTRTENA